MQSDQAVVKVETEEQSVETRGSQPQTTLGAKLIALAQEIDRSGLPKLTVEEIEEYLGRKLGGIAEAFPDGVRPRAVERKILAQPEQATVLQTETEYRQKMTELFNELDASDLPKLSLEEIEEYLGRKLGGIAAAFPAGIIPRDGAVQPRQD